MSDSVVTGEGVPDVGVMTWYAPFLALTTMELAGDYVRRILADASPAQHQRLRTAVEEYCGHHESREVERSPEYRELMTMRAALERVLKAPDREDLPGPEFWKDALEMDIRAIDDHVPKIADYLERVRYREDPDPPNFLEREAIAAKLAFFATRPQRGGATPPEDVSLTNVDIYKLLQLAEAIHDFAKGATDGAVREYLRKSLGAKRATMHVPDDNLAETTACTYRELTLEDMVDEKLFVKAMTMNKSIDFEGTVVENDYLDGRSFERGVYHHKAGENESGAEGVRKVNGFVHFEMFLYRDSKKPLLDLEDVLKLRKEMNAAFKGVDELVFLADQNAAPEHPGKERRAPPFLVALIIGTENTVQALKEFYDVRVRTGFKLKYAKILSSDASLHDGAKYRHMEFSPHGTTGQVTHSNSVVKFTFDGNATPQSYGFTMENTTDDHVPLVLEEPGSDRTPVGFDVTIDPEHRRVLTDRYTGDVDFKFFSTKELDIYLRRWHLKNWNCAALLTLKLARDWGQIEHCRRNGLVYVTCDRPAALYCLFRNVRLMYVNHHKALRRGAKNKRFLQYSFVLADNRVKTAPAPTTSAWGVKKSGGGREDLTAVCCALAAVTVLMAFSA